MNFERRATTCLAAGTAALILLSGAPTALGGILVNPAVNYPAGSQPSGVAAGDYDGDGDMDLATAVDGPDRIVTLINDGSGTYSAGPPSLLPNSSSAQDVASGDLDGDGDPDLAVAVRDPQGAVQLMINNGAGSFSIGVSIAVPERPRGLAIADHDGDGDMDIAVANRDSNSASVLTNTGGGNFSAANLSIGGETRAAAFGDFDGDGDKDLAVTDHDNRAVALFTNTGGSFSASGSLSVGGVVRPDGITTADLDANGTIDIAVGTSDQTTNTNQATVFLNMGGSFTGPFNYATGGTNTSGIRALDLDCDGLMDLATTNQDSNDVSLLQNMGGAVYGAPMVFAVGTGPDELTTADLDQDGDDDLAVANRDSNDISVLINDTCEPQPVCPADVDGDGMVGVTDLIQVILNWGACPGCPADVNGDDTVDVLDLTQVILEWGICP
jgi:hypothetical protein